MLQQTTVVAKEGTGSGGRYNATITVTTADGRTGSFVGSTLPTYPEKKQSDGHYAATIAPGTYRIEKYTDNYKGHGAPGYRVLLWDGGGTIPCTRYEYTSGYGNTATSIVLHQAEASGEWSTGCITVLGKDNMIALSNLIGNGGVLIVTR